LHSSFYIDDISLIDGMFKFIQDDPAVFRKRDKISVYF